MKPSRYTYLFFCILFFLISGKDLCAQWSKINTALFHKQKSGNGAMHFCDGIIWGGVDSLVFSIDTGKTWQYSPLPLRSTSFIHDIYFLDKNNGLVATSDAGVLRTSDGGKTWKLILQTGGDFWKAQFNGSTQVIHALGIDRGVCFTSNDGGDTWKESYFGTYVSCLAIASDHTLYVFSQQSYNSSTEGWIVRSTDFGTTWKASPTTTDGDCYTLSVDSCNSKQLYLLNEDYASTNDQISEIFTSSDAGETWQAKDTNRVPYFSGAMVTTKHAIYAATAHLNTGIVRSTDKGNSWKAIHGPNLEVDSRTLTPVDDNIIFAIDAQGYAWVTFNSGGDSLPAFTTESKFTFSSARIINDSTNITIHMPIYLTHSGIMSDVDMIMHYPTESLKLISTSLYNGKNFDVTANQWTGRTALHITGNDIKDAPTSLLGFVNFLWTPLENDCSYIDFDSIGIPGIDLCSLTDVKPFRGIIGSYANCENLNVSDNSFTNIKPFFRFTPNPAGDYGFISSDSYSGAILAKLYDMNGKAVTVFDGSVSPREPMKIVLRHLPYGVYHLSLKGQNIEYELSFVHSSH